MNPLLRHAYRAATWVLVVVVLASSLAALTGAARAASTTNYVLTGYVDQPGKSAPPVPAGVTVDLVSRATGAVYTAAVTGSGGQFSFTSKSTAGALAPGYWSVFVPPVANVTLTGCKPCAVLPADQNPTYAYYNTTQLTSSSYSTSISGVSVLPYNATLKGTVTQASSSVQGASVHLLAPKYAGLVLANNTTNSTGTFTLNVPFSTKITGGPWVLQVTHVSGADVFSNTSSLAITSRTPPAVTPVLKSFQISGHIVSKATGQPVPTSGNATMFDPTNGFLYTVPTAAGGYYSFSSYLANFKTGAQSFDVIGSARGYQTGGFVQTVASPSVVAHNVTVLPLTSAEMGAWRTTLNLSAINITTGKGNLLVSTVASLGNNTVLPGLPNGTVGQLWAQLGLDFNHTLSFPASKFPAFESWVSSSGPFFPAVQALATINGTGFVLPSKLPLPTFTVPACSPSCGPTSSAALAYNWSTSYALNGTIPKSGHSYTLSFRFAHPSYSSDVYNYTVVLPAGYALSAGTTAPAHAKLVGSGPGGTWTSFTLVSLPSATSSATATFNIVKTAGLSAIVNISAKEFYFSHLNVNNSTRGSYTVVLAAGENATFSAANSIFPTGTNGTSFTWNFGDSTQKTVTTLTTNHTYTAANGTNPWVGSLTIIGSGGHTSTTAFKVWILSTAPVAKISTNASSAWKKPGYLFVPWGTSLRINAAQSTVTAPNVLAIASFKLTAKNFTQTRNNSVAQGAKFDANWAVSFGGGTKAGAGRYVEFSTLLINGTHPTVSGWGWVYYLNLTVWSGVGTSSTATAVILVNDTQKPVASIELDNAAGVVIPSSGLVEQKNGSALVQLNGGGSSDGGNGSIVAYNWMITLKGNTSFPTKYANETKVKPNGKYPSFWLTSQTKPYNVTLTVMDENGNKAKTSKTLAVSKNATLRPIMEAANLTGPASVSEGSSYTYWVNITNGGGAKAIADNVTVTFYVRAPSGTGPKTTIAGSPASVVYYGYSNNSSNATVNATPLTSTNGVLPTLHTGLTVRAQITWNPSKSGSYVLYANVTATNEFAGDYGTTNVASTPVSVKANPTTQYIEYGAVAGGAIVVIAVLVLYWRRRTRRATAPKTTTGRGGLERGGKRDEDEEEGA